MRRLRNRAPISQPNSAEGASRLDKYESIGERNPLRSRRKSPFSSGVLPNFSTVQLVSLNIAPAEIRDEKKLWKQNFAHKSRLWRHDPKDAMSVHSFSQVNDSDFSEKSWLVTLIATEMMEIHLLECLNVSDFVLALSSRYFSHVPCRYCRLSFCYCCCVTSCFFLHIQLFKTFSYVFPLVSGLLGKLMSYENAFSRLEFKVNAARQNEKWMRSWKFNFCYSLCAWENLKNFYF